MSLFDEAVDAAARVDNPHWENLSETAREEWREMSRAAVAAVLAVVAERCDELEARHVAATRDAGLDDLLLHAGGVSALTLLAGELRVRPETETQ